MYVLSSSNIVVATSLGVCGIREERMVDNIRIGVVNPEAAPTERRARLGEPSFKMVVWSWSWPIFSGVVECCGWFYIFIMATTRVSWSTSRPFVVASIVDDATRVVGGGVLAQPMGSGSTPWEEAMAYIFFKPLILFAMYKKPCQKMEITPLFLKMYFLSERPTSLFPLK